MPAPALLTKSAKPHVPPLTEGERFAPTQPLPEYRERLREQRRWRRPPYTPNRIRLAARIAYGLMALTWVAWALIGLLSGHMFLLISKRGPIHLSGVPAILLSLAVVASAAACAVAIVDHYDRRDNEHAYRKARRNFWYSAAGLLVLSALIGLAERTGLLPYSDGRLGLLSTTALQSQLSSGWLSAKLAPHRQSIEQWSLILFVACLAGCSICSKLGLLNNDRTTRSNVVALLLIVVLVGPAVAAFALNLLMTLASGSIASGRPLAEDALRAQIAWLQTMLLGAMSLLGALGIGAIVLLLRLVGLLPSPEIAARQDAG